MKFKQNTKKFNQNMKTFNKNLKIPRMKNNNKIPNTKL